MRARVTAIALIAAALSHGPPAAVDLRAQEPKSAAGARQLVQLLEKKKLDAVAARHPGRPDMFVAALHFPGQLLVVWARYAAPALLAEKLTKGEYRDIYIDLNSASVQGSKILISDLGADGLQARPGENQPFDQQDAAGKDFRFDGNWRGQKMSEQDYMKVYAQADQAYADALSALIAHLNQG